MLKIINSLPIKYVVVHHFGGTIANRYLSTQSFKEERIENAHSARWNFPSKLCDSNIGYNVIVWEDGSYDQYRYIGEETAAQVGHNNDSVSIALAGNFTLKNGVKVDEPTEAQKETLTELLEWLYDNVGVNFQNFRAHRDMPNSWTECYGNALSGEWVRELLRPYIDNKIASLKTLIALYIKLLNLLKKKKFLGNLDDKHCVGHI